MKKRGPRETRYFESSQVDYDQLRTRTIVALDRLGHQKFSSEPGGYSLENWMRGVNLLLDGFEEQMGATKLPSEYTEKRRELTYRLSSPPDLSSVDSSISEVRRNEEEIVQRLHEARAQGSSRIDDLRAELARSSAELEEEKGRVSGALPAPRSDSVLKRLFGRKPSPAPDTTGDRVEEIESRVRFLAGAVLDEQKSLRSMDEHSPESSWAEDWRRLEAFQARRKELENERSEMAQFVKEREELTTSIAEMISGILPIKE